MELRTIDTEEAKNGSIAELMERLSSSEKGLSGSELKQRLTHYATYPLY